MGIIFPIILGIGIVTGKTIIMGAAPSDVILLALTLVLSALTFSGRIQRFSRERLTWRSFSSISF